MGEIRFIIEVVTGALLFEKCREGALLDSSMVDKHDIVPYRELFQMTNNDKVNHRCPYSGENVYKRMS